MITDPAITIELNPDDRRLYDRLRSMVVSHPSKGEASGLLDLVVLLPDFTVLLARLLRDERVPLMTKVVSAVGIAYVLSPVDLLPALLLGPVGLVDDLIVVAACLSGMLNRVHPDVVRSHWPGQGDALDVIASVTELIEDHMVGGFKIVLNRLLGGRG